MMLGLCDERMYGVFQLKRYASPPAALMTFARPPPRPPPPPPPPPRPPPGARPSTHVALGEPAICTPPRAGPADGRMLIVWPALRSYRLVLPSCDSQYTRFGCCTLTPVKNPSPPQMPNQSMFV